MSPAAAAAITAAGSMAPMLSTVASYAAEVHPEHHIELPFSHWGFGGIALALFMAMLGALWSFRGTAAKVPHSVDGDGHHADGHGTTDVSTRH